MDGYGHTALLNQSSCANRHKVKLLARGAHQIAQENTHCLQDIAPFTE
jgi:hypothetical protein